MKRHNKEAYAIYLVGLEGAMNKVNQGSNCDRKNMKLLHTSDWHLGHVLYGRKRYDEYRVTTNDVYCDNEIRR